MTYEQACDRYAKWVENQSIKKGVVIVPQTPHRKLSELIGTRWHLSNVNGPLAKVARNGRVSGVPEDNVKRETPR